MKASAILIKAQKFIKKGWTKFVAARDKRGDRVSATSKSAVRWCAVGSVWATNRRVGSKQETAVCNLGSINLANAPAFDFLKQAVRSTGSNAATVANWNDAPNRTKKQVSALFDKAIKLALAAGE